MYMIVAWLTIEQWNLYKRFVKNYKPEEQSPWETIINGAFFFIVFYAIGDECYFIGIVV